MSAAARSQTNSGFGVISGERNDDGLFSVTGVAIGPYDITVGNLSKERKLWKPEVLEEAASTLEGKDIVVNHENRDAWELVGQILEAKFDEDRGVVYRGEIDSEELAKKIDRGWLEVSPRIIHGESEEEDEYKIPQVIHKFDNLSIVTRGAAHSNKIELGNPEELASEIEGKFSDENSDKVGEYQMIQREEELQEDLQNLRRWLFDNRNGAIGAGQGLGCSPDTHTHTIDGDRLYAPCKDHDTFLRKLAERKGVDVEDMEIPEELQRSEARTPDYDGTETTSWGDIPADTLEYWVDALDYDDVEQADDLSQEQKSEIAQHSLLGDAEGDTIREIRFFPVVNARTGDLNRGALEAVRGGRGQSADIPQSAFESAYATAGRLLNEEFDSDVEVEFEGEAEELAEHKEKKRIAGQMSSMSALTRDEALGLIASFDPDAPEAAGPIADSLARSFEGVTRDKALEALRAIGILETHREDTKEATKINMSEQLEEKVEEISELDEFDDVESDELYEALQGLIGSDEEETEEELGEDEVEEDVSIDAERLKKMFNFR